MDKVTVTHPDYTNHESTWKKCRDAIKGQEAIKAEKELYLPRPSGMDNTAYEVYLKRAQFYNAGKRTVSAISGQIFRRKPIVKTDNKDPLESVSIDGLSFTEYSKNVINEWGNVGRVGTLVDINESKTPYLAMYTAESITNWKESMINGVLQLSLVVLSECIEKEDQIFTHDKETQYRVLKLNVDGIYQQEIWQKSGDNFIVVDKITPIINDKVFGYIPFRIINTAGAGAAVELPPLNDLVNINIGHYINSADFENDLHWSGVKTPIFPGWEGGTIPIGKAIAVDLAAKPYMLESTSGSGLSDEMTKKEERMAVTGSQILAQKGRYLQAAKTAEIQNEGESGILSSLSDNMDSYFEKLLKIVYEWGDYGEIEAVIFNKDFDPGPVDMEKLVKLSGLVGSNTAAYETFFHEMQKAELISKETTKDDYLKMIEEDRARFEGGNI